MDCILIIILIIIIIIIIIIINIVMSCHERAYCHKLLPCLQDGTQTASSSSAAAFHEHASKFDRGGAALKRVVRRVLVELNKGEDGSASRALSTISYLEILNSFEAV